MKKQAMKYLLESLRLQNFSNIIFWTKNKVEGFFNVHAMRFYPKTFHKLQLY